MFYPTFYSSVVVSVVAFARAFLSMVKFYPPHIASRKVVEETLELNLEYVKIEDMIVKKKEITIADRFAREKEFGDFLCMSLLRQWHDGLMNLRTVIAVLYENTSPFYKLAMIGRNLVGKAGMNEPSWVLAAEAWASENELITEHELNSPQPIECLDVAEEKLRRFREDELERKRNGEYRIATHDVDSALKRAIERINTAFTTYKNNVTSRLDRLERLAHDERDV